jgi:hypothetical protein
MKKNKILLFFGLAFILVSGFIIACKKDTFKAGKVVSPPQTVNPSFIEEFDTVGNLVAKGWVFQNNSSPAGSTGWRQGRYEPSDMVQFSFLAPVAFVGFPAYSAHSTPNDFVSCDVSAASDQASGTANYSAWLISPKLPLKNGDQIIFYTRAIDDSNYPVFTKDRMQVRANYTDGSSDVGNTDSSFGGFTTLLLDINSDYVNNDPAGNPSGAPGYPEDWTQITITLSGLPNNGSVAGGRFAFRYLATDAGLFGGLLATNYPTVVGIDQLSFISK